MKEIINRKTEKAAKAEFDISGWDAELVPTEGVGGGGGGGELKGKTLMEWGLMDSPQGGGWQSSVFQRCPVQSSERCHLAGSKSHRCLWSTAHIHSGRKVLVFPSANESYSSPNYICFCSLPRLWLYHRWRHADHTRGALPCSTPLTCGRAVLINPKSRKNTQFTESTLSCDHH